MPVPSEARIRFADAAGILIALGADAIKDENKVPAGLIEMSNGTKSPCFLDARYLLGPEGASTHPMVLARAQPVRGRGPIPQAPFHCLYRCTNFA